MAREVDAGRLTFPLGLAVAPDGAVWLASTYADRLVRFEPTSGRRSEVALPLRSHPVGLLVDGRGALWYAASGLGVVGRVGAWGCPGPGGPLPPLAQPRLFDRRTGLGGPPPPGGPGTPRCHPPDGP